MEVLSKGQCVLTAMNGYGFRAFTGNTTKENVITVKNEDDAPGNGEYGGHHQIIVRRPSMRSYIIPRTHFLDSYCLVLGTIL